MNRSLFILVVLLCFNNVYAQDATGFSDDNSGLQNSQNPTKPFGIATGVAYLGESNLPYIATVSIDYFFNPKFSAEFSYGIFFEHYRDNIYSIGFKYWFRNNNCINGFSPFIGLSYVNFEYNRFYDIVNDNIIWEKEYYSFLEIPIGIRYTSKFGLQASFQLSYLFFYDTSDFYTGPNAEFKIGWRINFRKRGNR